MPFISQKRLEGLKDRLFEQDEKLIELSAKFNTVEKEIFVTDYFHDYPDSRSNKKILKKNAVTFEKVYSTFKRTYTLGHIHISNISIATFYTSEENYKKHESIIKDYNRKVKEFKKKNKR